MKQFVTEFSVSDFLHFALEEAKLRRGYCAPNPAVGAVVEKKGEILSVGKHWQAGKAHAEVDALEKLSQEQSRGATLYVTLEPCCHYGKTPPCTNYIIEREIAKVVYAFADPNPLVAGKGHAALIQAGIVCEHHPIPEIDEFYRSYRYWRAHQRPWVTAKLALSLDGKIASASGAPAEITGEACRQLTHEMRNRSDAILSSAKTILLDNPQLNVRLQEVIAKPIFVVDRDLHLSGNEKIFTTAASLTLFHAMKADPKKLEPFLEKKINCVPIPNDEENLLHLPAILDHIGKLGYHDLWVEAGGKLFYEFFRQKLMQRALIYVAPKTLGEEAKSAFFDAMDIRNEAVFTRMFFCGEDAVWDFVLGS